MQARTRVPLTAQGIGVAAGLPQDHPPPEPQGGRWRQDPSGPAHTVHALHVGGARQTDTVADDVGAGLDGDHSQAREHTVSDGGHGVVLARHVEVDRGRHQCPGHEAQPRRAHAAAERAAAPVVRRRESPVGAVGCARRCAPAWDEAERLTPNPQVSRHGGGRPRPPRVHDAQAIGPSCPRRARSRGEPGALAVTPMDIARVAPWWRTCPARRPDLQGRCRRDAPNPRPIGKPSERTYGHPRHVDADWPAARVAQVTAVGVGPNSQGGDTDPSAVVILASTSVVAWLVDVAAYLTMPRGSTHLRDAGGVRTRLAAHASAYYLPGPWLNLANA